MVAHWNKILDTKSLWNGKLCCTLFDDGKGWNKNMIKHWIEAYHQTGIKYGISDCRAASLENQVDIGLRWEKDGSHPQAEISKFSIDEKILSRSGSHE